MAASASYRHSSRPRSQAVRRAVVTADRRASTSMSARQSGRRVPLRDAGASHPAVAAAVDVQRTASRGSALRGRSSTPWSQAAVRSTTTAWVEEHQRHGSNAESQESGTWVATNTPRSIGRNRPFATSLRRRLGDTPAASASCERERSVERAAGAVPSSRTASRHQVGKRACAARCPNCAPGSRSSTGARTGATKRPVGETSAQRRTTKCPVGGCQRHEEMPGRVRR